MNLKTAIRPTRRRAAVLGAVAGVATLTLTAATGPANAARAEHRPSAAKPTVVLVHGAFADSSSWNGVIERLQREGYPVIAPANPLRGPAGDAAYIHSVIKSVKGPVVLVGHSYGGSVISEAAVDAPQVKALVYIAAFAPDKGESALGDTGAPVVHVHRLGFGSLDHRDGTVVLEVKDAMSDDGRARLEPFLVTAEARHLLQDARAVGCAGTLHTWSAYCLAGSGSLPVAATTPTLLTGPVRTLPHRQLAPPRPAVRHRTGQPKEGRPV
ncbi:alpha/beta fold hydrolase [Streptomyces fagopyri]